jgi:hypothetical protein
MQKEDPNETQTTFYPEQSAMLNCQWPLLIPIFRNSRDANKIKTLKGKVTVTLLSGKLPDIVVEKIVDVKKKKLIGSLAEIEIEKVEENNKEYQITMRVENTEHGTLNDPTWQGTLHQRFDLIDAKGRVYTPSGIIRYIENGPALVHGVFTFTPGDENFGPPVKLIMNRWLGISELIEFELKEIPLP